MKIFFSIVLTLISFVPLFAQPDKDPIYKELISKADSTFRAKNYRLSSDLYKKALTTDSFHIWDRFSATFAWTQNNEIDLAIEELKLLVEKKQFDGYLYLLTNPYLIPLTSHTEWTNIVSKANENRFIHLPKLNMPLVKFLDTIHVKDQVLRLSSDSLEAKYGGNSKEVDSLWKVIAINDSINLYKIKKMLEERGWPNIDEIGDEGSSTIFLVIQHANLRTQMEMLPLVKTAFENGKLRGDLLAMLEDRINNRQGKLQVYGTQMGYNKITKTYYVQPLEDPDNVDIRRAKVGLTSLADYVGLWDTKWDVQQYKKDLPTLIENLKKETSKQ